MLPLSVPVKPYCSWSCWLKVMKIRWDLMWFSICAGRNHCKVFYLDIKSSSKRWISECTCVLHALCNFWLCMIQKLWPWSQEGVASVPSPVVLEILIIQLDNQDCGAEWTFPKSDMFTMIQNRQTWSKCASVFLSWTCMCCCLAGWTMCEKCSWRWAWQVSKHSTNPLQCVWCLKAFSPSREPSVILAAVSGPLKEFLLLQEGSGAGALALIPLSH